MTGSLLFRVPAGGKIHFVSGGGLARQWAHTVVNEPPFGRVGEVEWLNLLHGRIGADWDVSGRLVIRTDAVVWIGEGLDWMVSGRVGLASAESGNRQRVQWRATADGTAGIPGIRGNVVSVSYRI